MYSIQTTPWGAYRVVGPQGASFGQFATWGTAKAQAARLTALAQKALARWGVPHA